MPNTRDIRRRIKSITNTAQITRAMELVAASKMKKAQDAAVAGRPYGQLLAEILHALAAQVEEQNLRHPLLDKREVKHRGILLISADRGLCGPLLSNLFHQVTQTDPERSARYTTIGRKGRQFISRTRRNLMADFAVSDKVPFAELRTATEFLLKAYEDGEIDTVEVLYSSFINNLRQEPLLIQLAPVDNLQQVVESYEKITDYTANAPVADDRREMLFEPAPDVILNELLDNYIKREIHQMALEAKASEHSARRVAMKNATDNANDLIADLRRRHNKLRQAAITQEILEISAAAVASN